MVKRPYQFINNCFHIIIAFYGHRMSFLVMPQTNFTNYHRPGHNTGNDQHNRYKQSHKIATAEQRQQRKIIFHISSFPLFSKLFQHINYAFWYSLWMHITTQIGDCYVHYSTNFIIFHEFLFNCH